MALGTYPNYDPTQDVPLGRIQGAPSSVAATAPTNPTTPGGRITIGGFTPDYAKLLTTDPAYLAWQASSGQNVGNAAAARAAALKQLAIQFGGLPQGFADQYGDIDAQTLQLAGKNQHSDQAQLARNYSQGVEAFKRQLAGRGALQSGDLQYGLDNADYARGQQSYDLGNQFGASARQAIGNFQGVVGQENQNQVNAISEAEQNVYSNPLAMSSSLRGAGRQHEPTAATDIAKLYGVDPVRLTLRSAPASSASRSRTTTRASPSRKLRKTLGNRGPQ